MSDQYSVETRHQFIRRLDHDWRELADLLGIELHERNRFPRGDEPREILEWLQRRNALDRLRSACQAIGRGDLAELLARDTNATLALPRIELAEQLPATDNGTTPALTESDRSPRGPAVVVPTGVAGSPRFTLPARDANFTGRGPELDSIAGAVLSSAHNGRVFAIHAIAGMAGVGKTTLAVEVGHLLSKVFTDGQLFVDLKGHTAGQTPTPPADVLAQLINAEGVAPQHLPATLDERTAMWRALIGRKRVLLILDNAAGTDQVRPLLPGSPESVVIVTSRRALGDLGAVSVVLDTLPAEEACQMFMRLAPDSAAEPDRVAELVRMCGYLPLAISLLSGLFASRSSWTMKNLIDEARIDLLHLRAESRTIAAAFEVSYYGQDIELQQFFRLVGLHPGVTMEPNAAAALTDVSIQKARMCLDRLSSDHLMSEPAYRRYRMHDLVREYVRGLTAELPVDEREHALDRLLDYYIWAAVAANAHLARRSPEVSNSISPCVPVLIDQNAAAAWMSAEIANVTACLDMAMLRGKLARLVDLTAAVALYLRRAGPWDDAIGMHTRAAAAARELGNHRGQAAALSELGVIQTQRGDYPSAMGAFHEAMQLRDTLGDRHESAGILAELAIARHLSGDYSGAGESLDQALVVYREYGDRLGEAGVLAEAGVVYRVVGDNAQATIALTRALDIYRDDLNRQGEARALADLGLVNWAIGDVDIATINLESASRIFMELSDRIGEANSLHYLGIVRTTAAQLRQAQADLERSLAICMDIKYRHGEAGALVAVGRIRELAGDHTGSITAYQQAYAIYTDLGNLHGKARSLLHLASGCRANGDFHDAECALDDSNTIFRELENGVGIAIVFEEHGRLAHDMGRYSHALIMTDEALRHYRDSAGNRPNEASALNLRGNVLRALGRIADSRECHEAALALARQVGWPLQQARALEGIGRCECELGHTGQGREFHVKANVLYKLSAPGESIHL